MATLFLMFASQLVMIPPLFGISGFRESFYVNTCTLNYCEKGAETLYLKTTIMFTYFASLGKDQKNYSTVLDRLLEYPLVQGHQYSATTKSTKWPSDKAGKNEHWIAHHFAFTRMSWLRRRPLSLVWLVNQTEEEVGIEVGTLLRKDLLGELREKENGPTKTACI